MADTRGIRAGRAFVELGTNDSKLVRGLRRAKQRLQAFGAGVRSIGLKTMGLGTSGLAPLLGAAKVFSTMGDQVAKMAKRTGLSVETLSELRFVASQTGTEFASLEMGFRRMQRSIYDAGRGLSTAKDALTDLGLKFEDLDGLSPEQQFKLLGETIGRIEDPTKKAAIAMTLFGRTGTNLLPMFAMGAAGIEKLQKEARRLGLTMSSEDAKAAEDFTDVLDALWKTVKMGVFRVGAALAPTLEHLAIKITGVATRIGSWIQANRRIIVTIMKVAAGVTAVGATLVGIGVAAQILAFMFGGLASIVSGIGMVFGLLLSVIGALVSPLGLAATAVIGLGSAFLVMSGAGGEALDWLMTQFGRLRQFVGEVLGGITDALVAGDINLAAKVLWAGLKLAWEQGVASLKQTWLKARQFFVGKAYEIWYDVQASFETAIHTMTKAWLHGIFAMRKAWATFGSWHKKAVENTANWMAKRWLEIQGLFDETLNVKAAKESVDQQSRDRLAEIDSERDAAFGELDSQRNAALDSANQQHIDQLREIEDAARAAGQALDQETGSKIAAAKSELDQAREELQAAIAKAKGQREKLTKDGSTNNPIDEFIRKFNELGSNSLKASTGGVFGTFNVAALRGIGGKSSDVMERIATATEETALNTGRKRRSNVFE